MTIELSAELEAALKAQADARGLSATSYVQEVLQRDLGSCPAAVMPLETGYGMWKKYGISLSEEDIDENRRDMFRNFGEDF